MKSVQSTPFSKSKLLSLPFVLGLLFSTASASPIPNSNHLSRRDEQPQGCPGTLRGPSGNAYFAFSSNLNNQVAKEACASCYGGVLANVGYSDLQFLGANLEQPSWIRSWNGDDYSNSCLTLQPSGGLEPGVGVDGACASQNWPLCQATTDIPDGVARVEGVVRVEGGAATLISLALAYTPVVSWEAPASEIVNQVAPVAEAPVSEAPVSEAPAPVAEALAPVAEASASVVEAPAPIVETPAPIVQSPPPAAEAVDPLMVDKDKVRAAFEENLDACSAQLAYGEQDPVANEYMIEHMAETEKCSEARHAARAARLAKENSV